MYSALTLQFQSNAHSMPPPTVQEAAVSLLLAMKPVTNGSVTVVSTSTKAAPPLT